MFTPKRIHSLIYILATLGANLTAAILLPLGNLQLTIGALICPIQVAVGTVLFGLTFTQRDRLHHFGRAYVYRIIGIAACSNLLLMGVTNALFPGTQFEVTNRVIAASFLAIILAESADTEIYQKLIHRPWFERVMGSNAVSIPLDTVLFTLIAFWGDRRFSLPIIVGMIVGDILVKFVMASLTALYKDKWEEPRSQA